MIYHRMGFGQWLTDHGLCREGVEVGVQVAENAERIMQCYRGKIHLVDPYVTQSDAVYLDGTNKVDFRSTEQAAHDRMRRFGGRVEFHKELSLDFANKLTRDDYFDFVYLDGNHRECVVSEEIRLFWPKIRRGGILGGHDFEDRLIPGVYDCGVESAVRKFIDENRHLDLWVSDETGNGGCGSWWIPKPF